MNPTLLYRIASVLLVLFAGTHTYGMFQPPSRRATIDTVTFAMKNFHFEVLGATRSMWDFYFGFGMLLTAFLLFSALLSWQLGSVSRNSSLPVIAWGFAACYAAVAVLCWIYFFPAPGIVSTMIAVCLMAAAAQKS